VVEFLWSCVAQLSYFDDHTARCLRALDSIDAKDTQQKFDYFNRLSASMPFFPEVRRQNAYTVRLIYTPVNVTVSVNRLVDLHSA